MNKNILRKEYRSIRDNIVDRDIKSDKIFNNIINSSYYKGSTNIALYYSFGSEVDTLKLIEYSLNNKNVYLPRVIDDRRMEFYKVNSINDINYLSNYGILEPSMDIKLTDKLDLVIVPGICFDSFYNRIGYGKGYYDNYFKDLDVFKIGICFHEQLFSGIIDTCESDIKMDYLITDRGSVSMKEFICKIPSLEEMNTKWDYEIEHNVEDRSNWIIWKESAIKNMLNKDSIPYYGILDGKIIVEGTAFINPNKIDYGDIIIDDKKAYLMAFRTIEEYQGQGYFSKLFKYMLDDLRKRGYSKVTIGVEPDEIKNKEIYSHFGFNKFIMEKENTYPDGTIIKVEYYEKDLLDD